MPSYNRNLGGPRGFVATLTPEGQIKKVVADMNNLKEAMTSTTGLFPLARS
jgi:hypothetical protein